MGKRFQDKEFESGSMFNMAIATLQRIDNILRDLHTYNNMGHLQLVHKNLYSLYKEIYPFLKENERKEAITFWNNIQTNGFYIEQEEIKYSSNLTLLMDTFEFWIRDQLHKKGLLMTKQDDPSLALAQF